MDNRHPRKNILLFAGAISPYRGSEFSVAWNYVTHMNKLANIFVLYYSNESRMDVERYLSDHELDGVHFFFCDAMPSNWYKKSMIYNYIALYVGTKRMHKNVLKIARNIIENNRIDVIHFLNPIGFKEPGFLWRIDKPYVWGPVQAVTNWPLSCCRLLSLKGWSEFILRTIFHNIHFYFNRRVRKAFNRANVAIAATKGCQKKINKAFHIQSLYRPENALVSIEVSNPVVYNSQNPLNIIAAGTLNDRKCLKLFLMAMSLLKKNNPSVLKKIRLHVCGSGYLESSLKRFCEKKGIDESVVWYGRLSREDTQKIFSQAHLHIITSLGEATTTVLWEAMSKGIPTLSLNHCGMGSVLTEDSSFLIEVRSLNKMLEDIVSAINLICVNPNIIEEKSKKTLELTKSFTWEEQVKFYNHCYDLAINRFNDTSRGC